MHLTITKTICGLMAVSLTLSILYIVTKIVNLALNIRRLNFQDLMSIAYIATILCGAYILGDYIY